MTDPNPSTSESGDARIERIRVLIRAAELEDAYVRGYVDTADLMDALGENPLSPTNAEGHGSFYGSPARHDGERSACRVCPPIGDVSTTPVPEIP